VRLHVDTDLGENPDDVCALALVLGSCDVELTGVTTVGDPEGQRAGYVRHVLTLAGRPGVPVAAGGAVSRTTGRPMGRLPAHDRYWARPIPPVKFAPGDAVELLQRSVEAHAAIAAIGPYTNLAELETQRPGRLRQAQVFAMGGWFGPLDPTLPDSGPGRDTNVQRDPLAAIELLHSADVTFVPLAVTFRAQLRGSQLPRLAAAGPLGALMCRQLSMYAEDRQLPDLSTAASGVADDVVAFLHDPLTCAAAIGWPEVSVEPARVKPVLDGNLLRFDSTRAGSACRIATAVNGESFVDRWLTTVAAAGGDRPARTSGSAADP
jgi:purine nucleosidase